MLREAKECGPGDYELEKCIEAFEAQETMLRKHLDNYSKMAEDARVEIALMRPNPSKEAVLPLLRAAIAFCAGMITLLDGKAQP